MDPWLLTIFVLGLVIFGVAVTVGRDEITSKLIGGIILASMLVAIVSGWFLA